MPKIKALLAGAFLLMTPCVSYADLNKELNDFFNQVGAASNVTTAEIYNGQKAGYATGGSITMRGRVMNSQLASVNLPSFDAGCGGIDIFAGGFSFINHDQLINTLKSIGSASIGYAFLLGLETVSPQVANTIKQLQTWANTINSLSINSCETASQLVGAVWPKETMARQQICRSTYGKDGRFADYISARHNCAQKSEYDRLMSSKNPDLQGMLRDEYNVAWEAIQKQPFLARDKELTQFFMNLMGTVIVRKSSIDIRSSKFHDEKFLKTLLEGGQYAIYKCASDSEGRCLNIKESELTIDPSKAWMGKVKGLLESIQRKVLSDEELSQEEKDILAKTRLPLYKIVNVLTAHKKGHCPIDMFQVAEIVAMDLMIQYLREVTQLVREGAQQVRNSQMYADSIDRYLEELSRIESTIRYYEKRSMSLMDREFQMIQKIQLLEDQIISEICLN